MVAVQRPALQLPPRRAAKTVKMRPISRAEGGQLQAPVGRPNRDNTALQSSIFQLPVRAIRCHVLAFQMRAALAAAILIANELRMNEPAQLLLPQLQPQRSSLKAFSR